MTSPELAWLAFAGTVIGAVLTWFFYQWAYDRGFSAGYRLFEDRMNVAKREPPTGVSFLEAMDCARRGLDAWKSKPRNASWWRYVNEGTPIPNDLLICIAEEFAKDRTEHLR